MEHLEIEKKALSGDVKEAWEGLMAEVGIGYKDVEGSDNLFYQTAPFSTTQKMLFVNDVLPKEILARDDSKETKRLTAVLMGASKAYNFTDDYSSDAMAGCAESLEAVVPFVSEELQHKAYAMSAHLYGRKKSPSNQKKQAECLLKALDLAPTQSLAKGYADDFLFKFTQGGYEHKSSYEPEALDKEIELYEKVLLKPADNAKLESQIHNELCKGYTCKAGQVRNFEEVKRCEEKASQHKMKVLPPMSRNMGRGD